MASDASVVKDAISYHMDAVTRMSVEKWKSSYFWTQEVTLNRQGKDQVPKERNHRTKHLSKAGWIQASPHLIALSFPFPHVTLGKALSRPLIPSSYG